MPYPMWRMKYSSIVAGGGVHGKGVGTDPDTMTEAGIITVMLHLFIHMSIRGGGMIIGIINGEGNPGGIVWCLTMMFVAIGVIGEEAVTGIDRVVTVAALVSMVDPGIREEVQDFMVVPVVAREEDMVVVPVVVPAEVQVEAMVAARDRLRFTIRQ